MQSTPAEHTEGQSAERKNSMASEENKPEEENAEHLEQRKKEDARSIFIENVDYKSTKQELQLILEDCGKINRITIVKDRFTGQSKGCAYLGFDRDQSVDMALNLSGTKLRGRTIRVHRKRTNIVGMGKDNKTRLLNEMVFRMASKGGAFRGKPRGKPRQQ